MKISIKDIGMSMSNGIDPRWIEFKGIMGYTEMHAWYKAYSMIVQNTGYTYYVPENIQILVHFYFTLDLRDKYYNPYFTKEKTKF